MTLIYLNEWPQMLTFSLYIKIPKFKALLFKFQIYLRKAILVYIPIKGEKRIVVRKLAFASTKIEIICLEAVSPGF